MSGWRLGYGWTRGMTGLVVACTAVYGLELLAWHTGLSRTPLRLVLDHAVLDPLAALVHLELWQLVTYQLLHDPRDPLHLVFNMLVLYSFGGLFERRWGTRELLRFLVVSGAGAGLAGAVAGLAVPSLFGGPIVGVSGALAALIMAFGLIFPEQRVQVWFVASVPAKQLVWALAALDLIFFLTGARIAVAVHAGGYLMGWLLVTGWWRWSRLSTLWRRGPRPRKAGRFKVYSN